MDRDLRIRLTLKAGDGVSQPLRDIARGSVKASAALEATRDRLEEIEKVQDDIAGFRALKTGLKSGGAEVEAARAKVNRLAAEIGRAEKPTRAMTREFERAKREAAQLGAGHDQQRQKLQQVRDRLIAAGVSTKHLVSAEQALRDEVKHATSEIDQQSRRVEVLKDRMRRFDAARGAFRSSQDGAAKMAIGGGAAIGAGLAVTAPIRAMAREAIDFESAMADVRKTVDGMGDAAEFEKMSGSIIDLSTRLPMAADGIAAIVAAGGQIKIPRAELLGFAEDATKMGIAFEMSGDEAGTTMAKWRAAFGVGRDGVMKLANQVNLVGNNGANTLNVTDIVTRIGPLGAVAGAASGEIAAMGATLDAVGVQSEIAATGIKNTLLTLTKGTAATKGQKAAFEALGLDAEAVSRNMQKNASATIIDVMKRVRGLRKDKQAGLLTELFGSESVGAIAPMLTQLEKLEGFLTLVNDQKQVAGSMDAEYASRSKTTANAIKLAENNIAALKITMGTELLPTITETAQSLGGTIRSFREFAQENPRLASGLVKVVGAFGALLFAAGSFLFIGAGVRAGLAPFQFAARLLDTSLSSMAFRFLKAAFSIGKGALGLAGMVGRAGLMLLTNPVALGIIALVAIMAFGGYMLWKHWGTIKTTFFNGLDMLRGLASRFRAFGGNLIDGLLGGITSRLSRLKETVVGAARSVVSWFRKPLQINSPSRVFHGFGGFMMEGLSDGIAASARDPARRLAQVARGMIAGMAGTVLPTPAIAGTIVNAAARSMPVLSSSPATRSAKSAGTAGPAAGMAVPSGPIEIHIHPPAGSSPSDIARAVRAEIEKIEREKARTRGSTMTDPPDWT